MIILDACVVTSKGAGIDHGLVIETLHRHAHSALLGAAGRRRRAGTKRAFVRESGSCSFVAARGEKAVSMGSVAHSGGRRLWQAEQLDRR